MAKIKINSNFKSAIYNLTLKKNNPVSAFLQIAVIDKPVPAFFENASIGNPITTAQNQRFTKRCNKRPIAAFFKNASIVGPKALG